MPKIVPITISGETHSISEWAEISGLPISTIRSRMKKGLQGEELIELRQDKRSVIHSLWHGKWVYIGNDTRAKKLQKRR